MNQRVLLLAASALSLSCSDVGPDIRPTGPANESLRGLLQTRSAFDTVDYGIEVRDRLRRMSREQFIGLLPPGSPVVVGFKSASHSRGVDRSGRLLVGGEELQSARSLIVANGGRLIQSLDSFPVALAELSPDRAADLLGHPLVDYIVPALVGVTFDGGSSRVASCSWGTQAVGWHISAIRADEAWAFTQGQTPHPSFLRNIAILDDGVNDGPPHPTEGDEIPLVRNVEYAENTLGNHGTFAAAVAGARNNGIGVVGVAPLARLASYAIQGSSHTDSVLNVYAMTQAILDNASTSSVMSISISIPTTTPQMPSQLAPLNDMINWAYGTYSVVFVASTGNDGDQWTYRWPAKLQNVIGVGGMSYFEAPHAADWASGNIELVAPSIDIPVVCNGGGGPVVVWGTSFSTPMVAAAAHMIRSVHNGWSADQVRMRLRATAKDIFQPGHDFRTGYGLINVRAAVEVITSPSFTVQISGMNPIPADAECSWSAGVSGGVAPHTYAWYRQGVLVSTSDSYTGGLYGGMEYFDLRIDVMDANMATASSTTTIHVGGTGTCLQM